MLKLHTYIRTYVRMYVRMYVCMYVCTYIIGEKRILGTLRCILCRDMVLISERPLSEISMYHEHIVRKHMLRNLPVNTMTSTHQMHALPH